MDMEEIRTYDHDKHAPIEKDWVIVNSNPIVLSTMCKCGNPNCAWTVAAYEATNVWIKEHGYAITRKLHEFKELPPGKSSSKSVQGVTMAFKVGDRVQIIKADWNKEAVGKTGEIRTINGGADVVIDPTSYAASYSTITVRLDEPLESLKGEPDSVPDEVHCLSQELSLEK